jgi:hypothetical protein
MEPGPSPEIVVKPADGRPFVTVGDYVATMHPWLVEHEALMRDAALPLEPESLDMTEDLFVVPTGMQWLRVAHTMDQSYDTEWWWVASLAKLRKVPVGGVQPDELPSTQPLHMAPDEGQGPHETVYNIQW